MIFRIFHRNLFVDTYPNSYRKISLSQVGGAIAQRIPVRTGSDVEARVAPPKTNQSEGTLEWARFLVTHTHTVVILLTSNQGITLMNQGLT